MNKNIFNIEYEIILALLQRESYGRALAKKLGLPLSTVQLALKSLFRKDILEYSTAGRNKIYSIKNGLPARQAVYSAEHYKLIKLVDQYSFLSPLIDDILKQKPSNLLILFGSYAKFSAKKDSDIDLFVETDNLNTKKKIESINSALSVKIGRFDKEDLLISEIIKNHIILRGVEDYYERLGFFDQTSSRR